ncbi:MAG TPA: SHOCT domain-containing protein [Acidimicrobiales bacterium]|nr:SHOCT domain-containing protein [Acidimicrobiales bacterium]
MYRFGPHHAHHPVLGIIFLVLIAALVVLGVIALVRWRRHPHGGIAPSLAGMPSGSPPGTPPWTGTDSALSELRIRYARGEISSEEFWQRASVLGYPPSSGSAPAGPSSGGPPSAPAP